MRKIFTVLTCLMLSLFSTGFASDAQDFRISYKVDPDGLVEYLAACGVDEKTGIAIDTLLQNLFSQLQIDGYTADHAVMVQFKLNQNLLGTLQIGQSPSDHSVLFASSLWENHAVSWTPENLLDLPERMIAGISEQAWTHEQGRFRGAAYDDCDARMSVTLSWHDMSALFDQVLASYGYTAPAGSPSGSENDRYSWYIVRAFQHQEEKGLSITLLDEGESVAELSLGRQADSTRLVLGAGFATDIWYLDLDMREEVTEDGFTDHILHADLINDPFGIGFEASKQYGTLAGSTVLSLKLPGWDHLDAFDYELYLEKSGAPFLIQDTLVEHDDKTGEMSISVGSKIPEEENCFIESTIYLTPSSSGRTIQWPERVVPLNGIRSADMKNVLDQFLSSGSIDALIRLITPLFQ